MRNSSRRFSLVLLLLGLLITSGGTQSCFIKNEDSIQGSNIFVSTNEVADFYLEDWFSGTNLTYTMEPSEIVRDFNPVQNPLLQKGKNTPYDDDFEEIIDTSFYQKTNGDDIYSLLFIDRLEPINEIQQFLVFGTGNNEGQVEFNFEEKYKIPDSENKLTQCLDVVELDEDRVVVDCVKIKEIDDGQIRYQDFLYIVNRKNISFPSINHFNNFIYDGIDSRKSEIYRYNNKVMIVQGNFKDEFRVEEEENSPYFNIYVYISESSPEFPQGKFPQHPPFQFSDFQMEVEDFDPVDFEVFGDRIYVLLRNYGILSFKYNGVNIEESSIIKRTFADLLIDQPEANAISITAHGAFTQVVLICREHLIVFRFLDFADQLYYNRAFDLPFITLGTPLIQTNHRYIIVQAGQVLAIYDTADKISTQFHSILRGVESFELLSSNILHVYYSTHYATYVLQEPILQFIGAGKNTTSPPTQIKITAESKYFSQSTSCSLTLHRLYLKPKELGPIVKADKAHFTYEFEDKLEQDIYLNEQFAGPNLRYSMKFSKSSNSVSNEDPLIEVDVPSEVELTLTPDISPTDEIFSKVLQAFNNRQLQIRQVSNYSVYIHQCLSYSESKELIDCKSAPVQFKLTGSIIQFAYGEVDDNIYLGFVTTDAKDKIIFRDLNGFLAKFSFQESEIGDINQVIIMNQLLYVMGSKNSVGLYKIYNSSIEKMTVIDSGYIKDWKLVENEEWKPNKINAHFSMKNFLFVELPKSVVVISIEDDHVPVFINQIPGIAAGYRGFLAPRTYTIVGFNNSVIREYSLNDITDIEESNDFQKYSYSWYNDTSKGVIIGNFTHNLYVLGYAMLRGIEEKAAIHIYNTQTNNFEQLYTVIMIDDFTADQLRNAKSIQFSVDGRESLDFLLLNVDGMRTVFRVPIKPRLLVVPEDIYPKYQYSSSIQFNYHVTGMNDQIEPKEVTKTIVFINPQETIYVNDEIISESSFSSGIELTSQKDSIIPLETFDWINGPVLTKSLSCYDCLGDVSGKNLIRLKSRVQELDEIQVPPTKDIKKLDDPRAAFFYAETKHLHVLTDQLEIMEFSAIDFDRRNTTNLELNPQFDECFELLPCKNENPVSLDPNRLLYGVAICRRQNRFIAAVAEYFTLGNTTQHKGNFNITNASSFVDAKCIDSKLYFLNYNENTKESNLLVYDLYSDIKTSQQNLTLLKTIDYKGLGLPQAQYTSLDIYKVALTNQFKVLLTESTQYLVVFDIDGKTLEITNKQGELFVNRLDLEQELTESLNFIKPKSPVNNTKILRGYKSDNSTFLHIDALVVIQDSPIYQIQLVFETDFTYFSFDELLVTKVYENYGDHKVQKRLSFSDDYFAASFFKFEEKVFTVVVYSLLNDKKKGLRAVDMEQPEYEPIWGGKEFTQTYYDVRSPFVVYYKQELSTKNFEVFIPSASYLEQTAILEVSDDDYLLVKPGVVRSQVLKIIIDSYFADRNTPDLYGYIEPLGQFDVKPFCEIVSDLYTTPSKLINSVNTREEYILRNVFNGFNLSYDLNTSKADHKKSFIVENVTRFVYSEAYSVPNQNIIATDQIFETSGLSTVASLSVKRSQLASSYAIWVGVEEEFLFPKFLKKYEIGFSEEIKCFDLEFVNSQQLVVYCVEESVKIFSTKYYDYFYVINIAGDNDIKGYQGLELLMKGTINSGKIMFYQDQKNNAINYLVTGPLFDSREPDATAFEGYIRIYKLENGVVSGTTFSTIFGADTLGSSLTLADFDVLDNVIYLLDFNLGIYSFSYDYTSVSKNVTARIDKKNFFQNHVKGFNYNNGYGMDVDYDGAHLVIVIAEYDQVLLFQQNRGNYIHQPILRGVYQADVQLENRPDIQVTNTFIGVRSGKILTIYRRDSRGGSVATLPNVYSFNLEISESLYTWNKVELASYLLGQPFLWADTLDASKLSADMNLTVISTNSILGKEVNCTVRLSSLGVPRDTTDLYNTRTESIIYSSENPVRAKNIPIDQQIVGPNIDFSLSIDQLENLRVPAVKKQRRSHLRDDIDKQFSAELEIPEFIEFGNNKLDTASIIFSQLIAIDDTEFLKIHQLQNFNLLFQECKNTYENEHEAECTNITTNKELNSSITSLVHGLYGGLPTIALIQSSEPNLIYLLTDTGKITKESELVSTPITNMVLNKQLLFFISNKSVYVIDTANSESTRAVINQDYIKNWKITNFDPKNFDPLEVEAHHSEGNILIIRLSTHTILVNVESKQPRFISAFEYDEQRAAGELCESHLLRDVFVTICTSNFIETYSLLINTSPQPLNIFEKYGYTPYISNKQHFAVVGNFSGLIYILAADKNNQTTLLIYRSHSPNIRSLYKAIELPSTQYGGTEKVQITATGYFNIDFVYIIIGTKQFLARVPHDQELTVWPGPYYPLDRYTNQFTSKFDARGMDGDSLTEKITLQFYNPQTRLLEDEDAIDASGINQNDGLEMTKEIGQKFPISVDKFVYGPVINYNIECNDCPGGPEGSGIITVQNRVVQMEKSYGKDLSLFKDVEGSFQNKLNRELYLLNNKRAYYVTRLNFEISPITIKLNLNEEAECYSYIPCYTPNQKDESQEKLVYAVAICKDGTKWYAAPVDYSQQIPSKLAAIELKGIQEFVQAQCSDESLLVLHTDSTSQESKIDVFEFFLAVQDSKEKNLTQITPYRTYSSSNLQMVNWTSKVLTGFEVIKTDNIDFRRLIISGKVNNVTTLEINAGDYTLKTLLPSQLFIDVAKRLRNNDQYIPGENVEIIAIKILKAEDFNKTSVTPAVKRFHTRVLVILKNLPLVEFLIDTPVTREATDVTFISILGLYAHIGDTEVSRYVSVGTEEFAVQYYAPKQDSLTVAIYNMNTRANFDVNDQLLLTPIFGGYALKDVNFYDHDIPVPVLLYVRDKNLLIPKEVKILIPYPQFYEKEPILVHLNNETSIIAQNSNFQTQGFNLIPESIYRNRFDRIEGIITPYDPIQVDIETEPYCRILETRLETYFNLWNTINKTEQYLLDDLIEGYNLSYTLENPLDGSTHYEIFDTLQEIQVNTLIQEELMEIVDFAISTTTREEVNMIRFGHKTFRNNSYYSVSFFEGSEIFAPTYQGSLNISTRDSLECYSVTYLNSKVGALFCTEYVTYLITTHVYREVFYLLFEGADHKYSFKKQEMKINLTIAQQMKSGKTVTLRSSDDRSAYLISAPLLLPNQEYDERDGTYLSVYEYVQIGDNTIGDLMVSRHSWITAAELDMDTGLNILDLQTYDNRIFILDYSLQIISFIYDSDNGVDDVQTLSLVSYGFREAWAFHIKQQSAFTAIFVSTSTEVIHLVQEYGNYTLRALERHRYPLEDELIVRPIIHSSGKYLAVQIKSMLTIYEKGQTDSQRVFRNIPKVQGYNLFQDNYLYIWQKHGVTSYLLEQPHMNVQAREQAGIRIPILTAISWNKFLDKNQTCTINFNPKNIETGSKEARKVFNKESAYFETDAEEEKNIFLDNHYIGPNLQYQLPVMNGVVPDLELDSIQEITVTYPPEYIADSIFDRIIQITDNIQLQIHQVRADNRVQFLRCQTSLRDLQQMECKLIKTLSEITSKIKVYTQGWFREEPSFLIVQESEPKKYYQYLYTGFLKSFKILDDVSNIIDIELAENTMFVLDMETVRGEIRIYSTLPKDDLLLISVIDDSYATEWGIPLTEFIPRSIITHYGYEDILLIQFDELLLAVSTQTSEPELLESKYVDDFGPLVDKFALTSNYLWNIRSDGIGLYDVRDEKEFGLLYELELYDYVFVVSQKTGFQYAVSNPAGFIYVVGEKQDGEQMFAQLLIFRESAQNLKNLYAVVDTGLEYTTENSYITITADGFIDVDYVRLNIDGTIFTIRVPHRPSLVYYPGPSFPLFGQSAELTFNYAITSMDEEQDIILETVKVIMINSHENIYLNTEELDRSDFSLGIEFSTRGKQVTPLRSQNWYNGPVLNKRLVCDLCVGDEPGEDLVSLKNRVQEIDKSFDEVDLKKLPNASASFFYPETKHIHVLNFDNEVIQYSSETYEIRDKTRLGGDDFEGLCIDYLPCKSNKIDLDPDRLLYGVAICEYQGEWVAAAIEYFTLGKNATARGIYHLKGATWYLDAKCMDSHLYFLDKGLDTNQSSIIVYDLYEGIKDNVHDLLVLKTINQSLLDKGGYNYTSFDIVKLHELNHRKFILVSDVGDLVAFDWNCKNLTITRSGLIQLSNRFNLLKAINDNNQYIEKGQNFMTIRAIKFTNDSQKIQTGIITALVVIENSPVYQIDLIYKKEDTYFQHPELYVRRVYQNYGSHEIQPRISFQTDSFFAVSYFSQEKAAFTVLVYSLDESQLFAQGASNSALEYSKTLGGVQFTETPAEVSSPFLVFYTSDFVTGKKVHKLVVPSDNFKEPTSISELNYDDYLITEEYLDRSQTLVIELDNFFDQENTVKIIGFIEPLYNIDTTPYCEVLNDQYQTPSQLYNSNQTREEYILRDSFSGFNLSYSYSFAQPTNQYIDVKGPIHFHGEEKINNKRQNIVGTTQITQTSGSSTLARLSMTRAQEGEKYYVWVGKQSNPLDIPRQVSEFTLEYNQNIKCLDLQLVTPESLIVYCLERVDVDVDVVEFYDFFYIIDTTKSSNPVTTFDGLKVDIEAFLVHGKIMSYQDISDSSINYIVTAPLIESSDSEVLNYIRIYQFKGGKISSMDSSTIIGKDLGLPDLEVADFDILDNIIYVLDHTAGVISFTFDYQSPGLTTAKRITLVNFFQNNQRNFRYQYGWGIDVDYDGAQIVIVIAEQTRVLLFIQNRAIKTVPPTLRGSFPSDAQLQARPEIQISNRYIGLKLGQFLTIFRKDFQYSSVASMMGVYSFNLEYQETLYIWNKDELEMYTIEDPYLWIYSAETSTLSTDVNLTVTSTNSILNKQVKCTVRFFSHMVEKSTKKIFNAATNDKVYSSDNPFRVKNLPIDQQIVGPNIAFQSVPASQDKSSAILGDDIEDQFEAAFDIPDFLEINKTSQINASDVIFTKIISTFDSAFTKVHQFKNFTLTFQECQNIYDSLAIVTCKNVKTDSNLTSPITEAFYGVYGGLPRFGFVQNSNPDTIYFVSLVSAAELPPKKFPETSIYGLVLNKQLLFFISNKSVYVIDTADDSKINAVIDKNYIKDWEIDEFDPSNFDPLEVDAHSSEGNILLIRAKTHVILVSVESKDPRLISSFEYDEQQMDGAFCESHLLQDVFLTFCNNRNFIESYSVLNLNDVNSLNIYEKYGYTPYMKQNHHVASVSESSGLIYLLAQDVNTSSVLLIYRSHAQNVRTLYKVLPLPSGQYDGQSIIHISATGFQNIDFVYFIMDKTEYVVRVPHNQQLYVRPGRYYPYDGYTNQISSKFQATGMEGTTKTETIKLQLYNPQTRLLEDENAIEESGINRNDGLEMDHKESQSFPITVEKFQYGPVMSYDLSCADCVNGYTKSNIIQIQNKLEDVTSTFGNLLKRLTEVEGSFQSTENNQLYILNDKKAHVLMKATFDDSNIAINLDVSEEADCLAYIPCYNPNILQGKRLEYTIAICEEGDHWVAVAINYMGSIPSKLAPITLSEVHQFVQAQCIDNNLLVLHTDYNNQESKIVVYDIYNDFQKNQKGTVKITYDQKALHFEGQNDAIITAFEVFDSDTTGIRRIFVTQQYNNLTTMGINTTNYHLISAVPVELTVDIAQRMTKNKLYFPGEKVETVSLKVLKLYPFNRTNAKGTELRFHYRVLVLLANLPSVELLVDCPPHGLIGNATRISMLGLYAHVGDTEISRHITVSEKEFALQFYSNEKDSIQVAVYYINTGAHLDEDEDVLFTPIHGGYQLEEIGFFDHDSPVPVLLYDFEIFKLRNVRIFIPYPQFYELPPRVFQINEKLSIIATNSSFSTQYFELVPISIYANNQDKIQGIITPYDEKKVVIETLPYCKILNERWESRINLWNSIDKTEQYLLDEYVEGYNLSFSIVDYLDPVTEYDMFDSVQEINTRNFNKEDVKDILDFAYTDEVQEDINIVRLGETLEQYRAMYSLTFFEAQEERAPVFRGKLEIDGGADVSCKSITYANDDVTVLYCLKELSSTSGKYSYSEIFYFLQIDNKTRQVTSSSQNMSNVFILDLEIQKTKTITLKKPSLNKTFIFSAPVVSPDQPEDEKVASFISVYEYTQSSDMQNIQIINPLKNAITNGDLELEFGLNIADIQIYGERVYVLDYKQGIVSFEYNGEKIYDVRRFVLDGTGIREAWGFLIKQQSAFTSIFLGTEYYLFHFVQAYGDYTDPIVLEEKYVLEDTLVSRPIIQSSGKYIAIQVKSMLTIYKRGFISQKRVFRNIKGIQGFNLFLDNYLYAWKKHGVTSYLLEQPHLNVRAYDESLDKIPIVTAISWNSFLGKNETCKLNLLASNINATSKEPRKLQANSQPLLESDPNLVKNIYLDQHYAGPNLQYEIIKKEKILGNNLLSFEEEELKASLDVPTEIKPNYPTEFFKDSSFSQLIQITDQIQIQIFQSQSSKKVQLLECNTTYKNITSVDCKFLRNISEITSQITVYGQGWIRGDPSFLFVQESEPSKIYSFHYDGSIHKTWVLEKVTKIVDIELAQNTLYVLDEDSSKLPEIRIYSTLLQQGLKLISVIDATYAQKWEIVSGNFKPLNIITHHSYLDLIFIKFEKILIAVSTQSAEPELLASKYLFDEQGNNFAVTANYLWNIRQNGISLYDVRDEKTFGILYDLELFDYSLVAPKLSGFQYSIANPSGFIYVVVVNNSDANKHAQIMILRETAQGVRNIYSVVDTKLIFNQETSKISLTSDGSTGVDYVLLNVDGNIFTIRVPHHPTLVVQPGKYYPKQGYSTSYNLSFNVKSMDGLSKIEADSIEIIVVNPQTEVFVDEVKVNKSSIRRENGGIKSPAEENSSIPIDIDGWFSGPVMGLKLFCEDACVTDRNPDKPLSIKNKIELNSNTPQLDAIVNVSGSVYSKIDNMMYILNENKLTVATRDLEIGKSIILFQPSQEKNDKCYELIPCYKADNSIEYVVAICQQGDNLFAYPVKIEQATNPTNATAGLKFSSKGAYVEAQCFNRDLFVLESNTTTKNTFITIYNLYDDINKKNQNLNENKTISQTNFSLIDSSLPITSFSIAETPGVAEYFRLFITQEKTYLSVFGLNKHYNIVLSFSGPDQHYINIIKQLKQGKVFISETSKIVNLKILTITSATQDNITSFVYDTIILIENSPLVQYAFTFQRNLTEDKMLISYNRSLEKLEKIYVQYGELQILRHFTIVDNYFAVSYYSKKNRDFAVVIYDENTKLQKESETIPVYHIAGGIQQDVSVAEGQIPSAPFQLLLDSKNQPQIFSPHPNTDESSELYSINKEVQILVKNNNFNSQKFELEIDSVYASERQSVVGWINSRHAGGGGSSTSNLAWILPISIIGGLLLFGGIGYYVWKKRKESLADQNDNVSEGGYSLQEQSNQSVN